MISMQVLSFVAVLEEDPHVKLTCSAQSFEKTVKPFKKRRHLIRSAFDLSPSLVFATHE